MPIHDWTRVSAGTFHDFHCAWIVELRNVLNKGLLPADYYVQAEQVTGDVVPDVLRSRCMALGEIDLYARKQRTLMVRHSSDDRAVALIELVSPADKCSRRALEAFVNQATAALNQGLHLQLIDLFPPGPYDRQGIHGAVWSQWSDGEYRQPTDQPLTLAAYTTGQEMAAFIEPVAVGDELQDMPLFLASDRYVPVPLEATYRAAWEGVPRRWRIVLER